MDAKAPVAMTLKQKASEFVENKIEECRQEIVNSREEQKNIAALLLAQDARRLTTEENLILSHAHIEQVRDTLEGSTTARDEWRNRLRMVMLCDADHLYIAGDSANVHNVSTVNCACGLNATRVHHEDQFVELVTVIRNLPAA